MRKQLSLRCPQCGGDQLLDTEGVPPSHAATCSACGASTPLSSLSRTQAAQEAERAAIEASRTAFDKLMNK